MGTITAKPHYEILDGLRGVAAVVVVCYHIFEAFATSHLDQRINHGYLAVDFFFILSGFVIGYAYDGRKQMSVGEFFKRRLVRLHPMVVMGAAIGAGLFYFQTWWDVGAVSGWSLGVAFVLSALLIPVPPGGEVRGLGEMFPLNGPSWSLFFEYLGNILYILILRHLSTRALAIFVAASGFGLAWFAIAGPYGDLLAGWQLTEIEFQGGSLRLLFAFTSGLLLSRLFRPVAGGVRNAFWICSAALVVLLAMPRIGGADSLWMNGLYDIFCAAVAFPLIVWLGASGGTASSRLTKFLGELSYPLYIVHYPLIYLYYGWVKTHSLTFVESLPGAAGVLFGSIAIAWAALRLYDLPLRRLLGRAKS